MSLYFNRIQNLNSKFYEINYKGYCVVDVVDNHTTLMNYGIYWKTSLVNLILYYNKHNINIIT